MAYIHWFSSWNVIKQELLAREELLEVLDGSEPESRAAVAVHTRNLRLKLQTSESLSYGYPGRNEDRNNGKACRCLHP